jgi:hypothetical protein
MVPPRVKDTLYRDERDKKSRGRKDDPKTKDREADSSRVVASHTYGHERHARITSLSQRRARSQEDFGMLAGKDEISGWSEFMIRGRGRVVE